MALHPYQLEQIRTRLEQVPSWLEEIETQMASWQSPSPSSEPARQSILFYRDYGGFTGGHLKVWDYFNHVQFSKRYSPSIYFTPQSSWTANNPWANSDQNFILSQPLEHPDLIFIEVKITLFLPNQTEGEGFYLPALEGMAVGTLVICPDCIGNRSFCRSGRNCLRPEYAIESLLNAIQQALQYSQTQIWEMLTHGKQTAHEHNLLKERQAFLEILDNIHEIW
ncbi:hypothetical protein [Planktothrix sp. FACHB-1365]|uniref:hypothetical protein n=1 Tax=Planktothrix sp. FACHB-1365 TaxID=2692855 RepID=UPI001682035F|nr:hypothetical protein [Planktothrix sp. FACHB-1365]MBD2484156.1 hypothetical protein [Planktothrix sp. FACHB-1365]